MKIGVLGSGSWGTTLALILHENGHQVTCWSFEEEPVRQIAEFGENKRFLPGVKIPSEIKFTMSLQETVDEKELIVVAVPSQAVRSVFHKIKLSARQSPFFVNVAKGIENKTLLRMSEVIAEVANVSPDQIATLSGPSHAEEVSRKIPTAVVVASRHIGTAKTVQEIFRRPYFRVYASDDIIGVELGGSLKNVIALAAGICDGAGFGDNTKAALITRGNVEISRLGVKLGARPETFAGLSGIGDLIVTCMSKHSRNRYVGEQIGKGRKLQEILNEMVMVAEGVRTTQSAYQLARREGVEMPITEQVYYTLFEDKSPHEALSDLMMRQSKIEDWA